MDMYRICYHYWSEEDRCYIEEEITGPDLNNLWAEYLAIGENHDLAKYGARSITKLEQFTSDWRNK